MPAVGRPPGARTTGPSLRFALEQLAVAGFGLILDVLLQKADVAASLPLWFLMLGTLVMTTISSEHVHGFLSGGDLSRRVWPRVLLHLALIAPFLYLLGWGPVLAGVYPVIALLHFRWSGSSVWRPAAVGSLAAIALGQTAIAAGWVHSYLSLVQAHVVAGIQATVGVLVLHHLGGMVAARERAEALLAGEERRFRKLAHNSSDLTVLADADGRVTWVSPSAWPMLDRAPESLVGHRLESLVDPADRSLAARLAARMQADPRAAHRLEWRLRHSDGTTHWYDVVVQNLLSDPDVRGLVINQRDVTEARQARERLAHDATHDSLTGLLNRAGFMRELKATVDRHTADQVSAFAVLYLDLNAFKPINDSLGHSAGDAVLVAVAEAIKDSILGADVAGRLGGDEFAVLLTAIGQEPDAGAVAQRISERITSPLELAGQVVVPSAAIGIATVVDGRRDAQDILGRADAAMYQAKKNHLPWAIYARQLECS